MMITQTLLLTVQRPRGRAWRAVRRWGAAAVLSVWAALPAAAESAQEPFSNPSTEALAPTVSPEERTQILAQLIAVRREAYQRRQSVEAGESARALVGEMNELRRQLREKNGQLEALVAADGIWADLRRQELELQQKLRDLTDRDEAGPAVPEEQNQEDDL